MSINHDIQDPFNKTTDWQVTRHTDNTTQANNYAELLDMVDIKKWEIYGNMFYLPGQVNWSKHVDKLYEVYSHRALAWD